MIKKQKKASKSEQEICKTCGFCCDGTLFFNAVLNPGEKGTLPANIEHNYFKKEDKEFFKLPCLYFNKKCTIYSQKKANVCSAYRCQLLKDFTNSNLTYENALEVIRKATFMREELFEIYYSLYGINSSVYYKEILKELEKKSSEMAEAINLNSKRRILIAKCNIFEALLIRHFRSIKEFKDLMDTSNDNNI